MSVYTPTITSGGGSIPKEIVEVQWRTAPNASGQVISANTNTVLILNHEAVDTGNIASLSSNAVTISSAGSYLVIAKITAVGPTGVAERPGFFSLVNTTNSISYGIHLHERIIGVGASSAQFYPVELVEWIKITGTTTFQLEYFTLYNITLGYTGPNVINIPTSNLDIRNRLIFYKMV
jgi:hypothetical protein